MESEFGAQFVHVDTHVSASDPFEFSETTARANRYGVSGIPHVMIDGKIAEIGADVCPNQADTYRADINSRIAETGGVSPVAITGGMTANGNNYTVSATFTQVDPGAFSSGYQATLYIYEDNVSWCCGYGGADTWMDCTRMVRSTPISLTGVGNQVTVNQVWDITTAQGVPAVPSELHAVAIMELIGGTKAVLQATDFVTVQVNVPVAVASVPAANGTANFDVHVKNIGTAADVLTLSVDNGFGWPTDFLVPGDPTYYTSHAVNFAANEEKVITMRVQTDGVHRIGIGSLSAQSTNNGQVQSGSAKVFNGSYAILFVDADGGGNNTDAPFNTALPNLGYLYDSIDSAPAGLSAEAGYDAIIWQTGYLNTTLADADMTTLQSYMDGGGKLFLSAMNFLTTGRTPNTFINNYLGVGSWTADTKATSAIGINGDPITNGMNMALTFPQQSANKVDTVNPANGGVTIFNNENTVPNSVRNERPNHARAVLSTIVQTAFPQAGADPNNSQKVIQNILQWLLQSNPAAVGDGGPLAASTLRVSPTPFSAGTELRFALTSNAARGPVSLHVIDASGRQVRSLIDGALTAGSHAYGWDGLDDSGRATAAGLYFAVLKTADGESSAKLIRVR